MSEAMSIPTSNSDEITVDGEVKPIATLSKSLLASLEEMIMTVVNIDKEQVTPARIEMKPMKYFPMNVMETLQSLYSNTQLGVEILRKFQAGCETIPAPDLDAATLEQLEDVVELVGKDLSSLPPSTFREQEYAQIAVQSLSDEMKRAQFKVSKVRPIQESPLQLEEASTISTKLTYTVLSRSISTLSEGTSGQMSTGSFKSMREAAHPGEPLFKSFCCPLTKEIMDDPVTIMSGVTYEKQAITEWFEISGTSDEVTCPTTGQKLVNRDFTPNIALKTTIEEWKERNEDTRIKVIHSALSECSSESVLLDAINDLHNICARRPNKRKEVCSMGMIPLLVKFLEFRDSKVRCSSLNVLQQLAQEDRKELLGKTTTITTIVRMLSSSHQPVRHAVLSLLVELSKSKPLSEKMGWVPGGILMLIKIKYDTSVDALASETADQILNNLSQCPYNIKCMAENGLVDPLLDNLVEGSDEMKLKMANYLSGIALEHNNNNYVAERACPVLVQMMNSGNAINRKAALKALAQLSSYGHNGGILIETGVLKVLLEEMFMAQNLNKPMDSLEQSAATVANILESGVELEDLKVYSQGHKLASAHTISNIVHMIIYSEQDKVSLSLIRILLCLTESHHLTAALVKAVKESKASDKLVKSINSPSEELRISVIRLLINLSSRIGHMLIDRICNTNGLLEGLIPSPSYIAQITESHVLSAKLLVELPHQNIRFNVALLEANIVPSIIHMINQIQGSGARSSGYAGAYMESIVGILVRFTATIYEPQILSLAMNYTFTDIFTDLITETSSNEVKRLAALGLEKLSSESISLSKQPLKEKKKAISLFCVLCSSEVQSKVPVCLVHKGICSSQNTFCLIEARAVEVLLVCLDHQNIDVVDSALSAISTLLDDKLDVNGSVILLNEMNATEKVIRTVREHKKESFLQKVFWMTEILLMEGGHCSASVVKRDSLFTATVVTAFHHGEPYTRKLAEKILTYLNKMPMHATTYSSNFIN